VARGGRKGNRTQSARRLAGHKRSSPNSRTRRARLTATAKWVLGILAAALTTVLAGALTNVFGIGPPPATPVTEAATPTGSPVPTAFGPVFVGAELPLTAATHLVDGNCVSGRISIRVLDDTAFAQPTRPPSDEHPDGSWENLPAADGTVSANTSRVLVTLQGRSQKAVVLTGISIDVSARRNPPAGTLLTSECGGPGAFRYLAADLDSDPPVITTELGAGDPPSGMENAGPIKFPYIVSASEPEVFEIDASTTECDCDWTARVSWQSDGRSGSITISNNGKPFRTSSDKAVLAVCSYGGGCQRR
jgi:hypothetical protein